ncbi:MAG: phage portal protein [Anaerolineae bacterium]|nr:phage portal protein [Anaerolineae bacterium]
MGLITSLLGEQRAHPSQNINWAKYLGLPSPTAAGVHVDHQTSLQQSTVFACNRVISETLAMLPLILYQRRPERGKDRAINHRLFNILRHLPNPEMTAIEFRDALTGHLVSWGNAFAEIEYANGGWVMGLWPLRPDRMRVIRRDGKLWYVYRMPSGSPTPFVELPEYRVMHVRGLSFDGVVGYDPISLARQSIGLAKGTEEFGARFFSNGAQTGTVYEHPAKLSDLAYDRLSKSIEKRHQGLENAHRIMILEEGMKANQVGIPPENAQFLETRKFQVPEIARFWRMPLHKIGYLENATFSNIEHQAIEFVTDTLQPWLVRWEQAIYRDLLTPAERQVYFAEHLTAALLRGDTLSRYQAYQLARQGGWLNANEIRDMENMNPYEGGDVYLVPLNMVSADQVGEPSPDDPDLPQGNQGDRAGGSWEQRGLGNQTIERRARSVAGGRQRLANSFRRVFVDVAGRVIRREVNDIRRAIKKHLEKRSEQDFMLWLEVFYEEHQEFWERQFRPVLLNYADQVGVSVAEELGEADPLLSEDIAYYLDAFVTRLSIRETQSSFGELKRLYKKALEEGIDLAPILEKRLDEWAEKKANTVAVREAYRSLNAFAQTFYKQYRVDKIRWVAVGSSCPYCKAMDGRVIDVEAVFLDSDTDFKPEGADRPLRVNTKRTHPPLHNGCDCTIVAEVDR